MSSPHSGPEPPDSDLLGVDPETLAAYLALADVDGDLEALPTGSAVSESTLAALLELRLIRRMSVGTRYDVVSPAEAAVDLLSARESGAFEVLAESARLRAGFRSLDGRQRERRHAVHTTSAAELVLGRDEVDSRLGDLSAAARRSVVTAHPSMAAPAVLQQSVESETRMIERGVRFRQLFTHTARRHPVSLQYLQEMQHRGAGIRTTSVIPTRMIVLDDEIAVLPAEHVEGIAVAIVRDAPVVAFLVTLFEHLWERSLPLGEDGQDEQLSREVEVSILHELAHGRTDEAIARRLGISTRTLRRNVSAMFERYGIDTRFQLGVLAAREGLLPDGQAQTEFPELPPR